MPGKITKLVVCDFDGTLFNSPHPPDNIGWGNELTLQADSFTTPVDSGFNQKVLGAMRQYQSDPSVYSVLLTGRPVPLASLVHKIIGGKVKFKEEHFSNKKSTLDFKKGMIDEILAKLPDVEEVEIWEDRRGEPKPDGTPSENHEEALLNHIKQKGLKATAAKFTVEKPIDLKQEVIDTMRKNRKGPTTPSKPQTIKEIEVGYAIIPKSLNLNQGIRYSEITLSDAEKIKRAKGKFFTDPDFSDLLFVTVKLPPSINLDSFKETQVPRQFLHPVAQQKKPEAA